MKKVILIATLLLSAFGYSAAVKWNINNAATFSDAAGNSLSSGSVYLVAASTSPTIDASSLATWTAQFDAFGTISGGACSNVQQILTSSNDIAAGNSYNFYLLVFDHADWNQAQNYYLSAANFVSVDSIGGATDQNTALVAFGTRSTPAVTPAEGSEWISISGGSGEDDPTVPEPTVLALLALGVAGLALRRRA